MRGFSILACFGWFDPAANILSRNGVVGGRGGFGGCVSAVAFRSSVTRQLVGLGPWPILTRWCLMRKWAGDRKASLTLVFGSAYNQGPSMVSRKTVSG